MYEKVENVKRPLKAGELFLVPCITRESNAYGDIYVDREFITPVFNHPHNDVENGQKEIHYHVDYRFVKYHNTAGGESAYSFPQPIRRHRKHNFVEHIRPIKDHHGKLEYILLPVINEDFKGITPVSNIKKSNLKHKCIHKGKCPHRGYDLSQVEPVNGIIRCPLHGLKFNESTKQLINTQ